VKLFVAGWDPAYGASLEGAGGADEPAAASSAQVDPEVEVPAARWRPIDPPPGLACPDVVFLVDGVRRIDAGLWTSEDDGSSYAGLAASYAAGVVRCDLRRGVAELAGATVERGLFTASPAAADVVAGSVRYAIRRVTPPGDASRLPAAVQAPLTALEVAVSADVTRDAHADLLVVDGPLRNRRQLPRTIGFVKSQHSQYLPPSLAQVVPALAAGQRTPVFSVGTAWVGWSWYLRLPARPGAPWAAIVRVECSRDLPVSTAVELAGLSQVTLPRFASSAYKDPRAPQNLVPIAGLERRLRGLLGDQRLLHRALAAATAGGS
jgi:hypothetical protein